MDERMNLPVDSPLMFFLILLVPLILIMLFVNTIKSAFLGLGFSPAAATALVFVSIAGSIVNIPVREVVKEKTTFETPTSFVYSILYPQSKGPAKRIEKTRIAVNLGGAIVPLFVCAYIFFRFPGHVLPFSLVTVPVSIAICYRSARIMPNVGVVMPTFVPPAAAAALALVFAWGDASAIPLCYVTGVLGVIVGADLLNLDKLGSMSAPMASIGGAGTFDGIFLTGIVSVFLGEVISFL